MNKLLLGLALMWSYNAFSQGNEFGKESFIRHGDTLPYRILWPQNFDESHPYPVMLFLHGAGERGNDNEAQLMHGSKLFLDSIKKYPGIVIFPQCPENDYWSSVDKRPEETGGYDFIFDYSTPVGPHLQLVGELIDSLSKLKFVDENRVYAGGLSMGGMGTFEIVARKPGTFAAAFAICGGGDVRNAGKIAASTPFWIFHGGKDDIVDAENSVVMYNALKAAGGEVTLTIFPEADHNSWDPAFATPGLLNWIFSQTKSSIE